MITKKNQGRKGEDFAISFLKKQGYKIIERNFHKRYAEIDIVALDKDTLVFIEVKTRMSSLYGHPAEAVTAWKIRTLKRGAYYYKMLHPELPDLMRIDVVAVFLDDDGELENIELIENITG